MRWYRQRVAQGEESWRISLGGGGDGWADDYETVVCRATLEYTTLIKQY